MKFSICNLGCKVNAYEAESCAYALEQKGFERTDFDQPADISLIFTCAVTNTAAAKSRKMMHRIRRMNPDCVIAMVGCYAQIDAAAMTDAQIVIGTKYKKDLAGFVTEYLRTGERIVKVEDLKDIAFEAMAPVRFENRARAFLKVQDGCNQFCSYCVIPYARGRERSMNPQEVIQAARQITKTHQEIVLTGIHTGRYGREYRMSLEDLIRMLLKEADGLKRLRISSIEITEISDGLLQLMQENPVIARHLHIPLQSGSTEILKAMHRPYTADEFLERLAEIRQIVGDDVSISTDVIAGFPGESEENFAEMLDTIAQSAFSFLHVFPFSPRSGTPAAAMKNQISAEVKKERVSRLLAESKAMYQTYMNRFIGSEAEVLTEECRDGYTTGHTSNYIPVLIKGESEHGVMKKVILKETGQGEMTAEEV